ncbi:MULTISPECIES: hypothetical protein [Myroides]|uniref:hypothetical protein n=1 Tax=Myroides TaxID=76831 RepID=UPI0003527330|nr:MULTISPECIES: hypothetical protein [Myroides]AJA67835.1 hypothetical protein MYRA21_0643 [Myroides sp. A21]EPH08359.1 hypothetical protein HMPREF9713_03315 [Myroides odoratimimus CCUG 12700]MDM1498347.1 hypothetical protein [Myroides odoratimimus]MDM1511514.1 hypothetical protein [Myroides odoratimimus]MDM1518556.1 hypothetical protein [Myroides odoratimimus]
MIKRLMLVLAVMLVGCKSEGSTTPYSDAKLEGIRGKVKAVTEVIRMSDSNVVSQSISLYDKNGYKISMESLDNELDTELLEFSSNGILKYELYNGQQRVLKGYDYEGAVISEAIQKWSSPTAYTVVTSYTNTPSVSNTIKGAVDKEGKISSMQMIAKDGESVQINSLTKFMFDNSGYQNGYIQKDVLASTDAKYIVMNKGYDSFGNITKQEVYLEQDVLVSEKEITYEYYE